MSYKVSGHVKQSGAPASRTVYVYSSADGSKLGGTVSASGDGSWSVTVPDATTVFVVAIPTPGYLPLTSGPITPVAL